MRKGRSYGLVVRWTVPESTDLQTRQAISTGLRHSLADDDDLLSVTLVNPNTMPDASRYVAPSSHVFQTSYARHEVVEHNGVLYYSLTDNNTTIPAKPLTSSFAWRMTVGAGNEDYDNVALRYGADTRKQFGSFPTATVDGHDLLEFTSFVNTANGFYIVFLKITGAPDFERVTWDDSGTLRTLNVSDAIVTRLNNTSYYLAWGGGGQWFTNLHVGTTQSGHFVRVGESSWATVPSEFDQNGLEIVPGPLLPDLSTTIGQTRYRAGAVINVVGSGLFSVRKYQGARNVVVATMHGSEPRTVQGQSVNSLFRAIHTNMLGEGALDNEYGIVGVAIQKRLQGTSDTWSVYILVKHSHTGTIDGSASRKVIITGGKLTTPVALTLTPASTTAFQAADNKLVTQYKTTTFTTEQSRELAKVAEGDQLTLTLTSVQDNPVNFIPELAWGPLEVEGWVQEMTRLPPQKRLEYQVRAGLPDITADTPVVAGAFARLDGKLVEGKAGRAAIASTQRNHVHLSLFQTRTAPDTRVYDASHGSKSGDTLGLITRLDFTRATLREGTTNEYTTSATITLSVSASLLGAPHFTQTPGAFKLVYTDAAGTTRTFLLVDAYRVTPDGSRVYQFLASTVSTGHSDVDFQLPTGVIEFQVFYGTGGAGTNTEANTTTKVLLNDAAGQTAVPARWATREGLHIDTDDNFLADEYDSLDASATTPVAYRTGKRLDAGYRGIALLWKVPTNGLGLTESAFDGTRLVTYYFDDDPQFTTVRQTFVATAALAYGNGATPVTYTILFRATDMILSRMPASGQSPRGTLLAVYPIL
ncbi:MAG: hypothetical protein OXU40_03980 [Nitrospira sp.]|nr:hypothetical protein [Nitrospira sp.]